MSDERGTNYGAKTRRVRAEEPFAQRAPGGPQDRRELAANAGILEGATVRDLTGTVVPSDKPTDPLPGEAMIVFTDPRRKHPPRKK